MLKLPLLIATASVVRTHGDDCALQLPSGENISCRSLEAFEALMRRAGMPVQVARMCYDRLYVLQCLSQVCSCPNEELQTIAQDLLKTFARPRSRTGRPQ